METIRVVAAAVVFCISSYLVYDLFANGFSWAVLLFCVGGYVLAHYMWPKTTDENSAWYDALELVIDLPYRAIAFALRSIGRVFRSSDGDIGVDL